MREEEQQSEETMPETEDEREMEMEGGELDPFLSSD